MTQAQTASLVLFAGVAVYFAWRASSAFRKQRPAIGIAMVFGAAVGCFEFIRTVVLIVQAPGSGLGSGS
ncbi:MAG: hypothetical protein AAGA57_08570 [Planctomycetota bacterium]